MDSSQIKGRFEDDVRQGLAELNEKMSLQGAELDRQGKVQEDHGRVIDRLRKRIFETNGEPALTVQAKSNERSIEKINADLDALKDKGQSASPATASGGRLAAIITAILTGLAALVAALKGLGH